MFSLNRIGVNAAPLLAGAGVLGIAIGFGSQKLVQDIITGLFLLLEDTMQVGDVVTLAGMSGTVERLSIRTIRLRGGDGSVNIIPFSAVTTVTNQTRDFGTAQISVGIAYEENVDHACAVLTDIARNMRAEPTWGSMMRDDLQINGLDQLGASALMITGQIRTGPGQHWAVRREFNRRMVARFAEEHIEIPVHLFAAGAAGWFPANARGAGAERGGCSSRRSRHGPPPGPQGLRIGNDRALARDRHSADFDAAGGGFGDAHPAGFERASQKRRDHRSAAGDGDDARHLRGDRAWPADHLLKNQFRHCE